MNHEPMYTNQIADTSSERFHWMDQAGFWLKVVGGWKREINKVVERSTLVAASSEVTAEVAKTAGELSELADNLDELSMQIGHHQLNLPYADSRKSEWKYTHSLLNERMNHESEKLRNLLSEMFKLDKSAYKRFLC
jgi:hypothetical protein